MGVYIPNMKMPKSCVKCHWYYELYDEHCTLGKFLLRKYPTDVSEEPYTLDTQRHPDCPLIDIVECWECEYYMGHEEYCENDHFAREYGFCYSGKRRNE